MPPSFSLQTSKESGYLQLRIPATRHPSQPRTMNPAFNQVMKAGLFPGESIIRLGGSDAKALIVGMG